MRVREGLITISFVGYNIPTDILGLTGIKLVDLGHAQYELDATVLPYLITDGFIIVRQDPKQSNQGYFDPPQRSFCRGFITDGISWGGA
jgi:hypothetical protein